MRWTPRNAQAMTALEALHQSNLWSAYWVNPTRRLKVWQTRRSLP